MTDTARSEINDPGAAIAASAAGLAAAGALACAACCVLPFALPVAALAVAGGALAWMARAYEVAVIAAIALVAVAWGWVALQSWRARKRPAGATILVMLAASTMLGLAYYWPAIEPIAIAALKAQ